MTAALLPSWRPGEARDRLLAFLAASDSIPVPSRVAVFDNDGTLWSERPAYPQLEFFLSELAAAIVERPGLGSRPEYAALIDNDRAAQAELGMPRLALALAELFDGMDPTEFTRRSLQFITTTPSRLNGRPLAECVYQPMLELLDALRAHDFSTFIVTGGGTEFVRAFSQELYGVPPEGVVGTLVGYEVRDVDGVPVLVRTASMIAEANEGDAKVANIQRALGRRPVFAAGNSAGDQRMLEWTAAGSGPSLALIVDHDDDEREEAYESVAGTFETTENFVEVAHRHDWVVASMRDDWGSVFPSM